MFYFLIYTIVDNFWRRYHTRNRRATLTASVHERIEEYNRSNYNASYSNYKSDSKIKDHLMTKVSLYCTVWCIIENPLEICTHFN